MTAPAPTLLLVDGTAVAYRAFFAVRSLTAPDGHPVNCLFGFVRLLDQLVAHVAPARTVVAFDGGSPACRLALCPDYKAQRAPMPPDLRSQLPLLNEFLALAGIPALRLDHEEADDVLGTLASRAAADGWQVRIATADKDLMQLVSPSVTLLAQSKDLETTDAARVRAKTGVDPSQIVEWLALVGDTADNIPGVPGIGPKTAAALLQEHGTLAALYDALPSLPSDSLRAKLADARPVTDRNTALMTIDRDLPGLPSLDDLSATTPPPAPAALLDFYHRHGLRKFAASRLFLPSDAPSAPPPPPPPPPPPAQQQLSLF